MTLNRRHKAILFLTLVLTGCALLLGAELKEAFGAILLGVAFAWAIGSDATSKLYSAIKRASGTFYSWVRLPIFMALAGGLLSAILIYTSANPVIPVVLMCAVGIAIAPLTTLPSKKVWLRIPLIILAGIAFILAFSGVLSAAPVTASQYAERFGQLAATGFIALLVGVFWLSKGWRLIEDGISAPPPVETIVSPEPTKGPWGYYISLWVGLLVLTLWLSILAWLASSAWAYAPAKAVESKNNNLLIQVGFVVVLALWPYRAWKTILKREPNSVFRYLRRHRRGTVITGMVFVIVMSLAVTYGIQNGNDQHMVERITAASKNLISSATKIGAIKHRDLRTTDDYIEAYAEIETLLPEFESAIQKCSDTYDEVRQVDEKRGFINTQVFYKSHNPDMWKNDYAMLDLIRQADSLTMQEVLTIRNIASLPTHEQVAVWQKEFRPFIAQEDELLAKIQSQAVKIQSSTK